MSPIGGPGACRALHPGKGGDGEGWGGGESRPPRPGARGGRPPASALFPAPSCACPGQGAQGGGCGRPAGGAPSTGSGALARPGPRAGWRRGGNAFPTPAVGRRGLWGEAAQRPEGPGRAAPRARGSDLRTQGPPSPGAAGRKGWSPAAAPPPGSAPRGPGAKFLGKPTRRVANGSYLPKTVWKEKRPFFQQLTAGQPPQR